MTTLRWAMSCVPSSLSSSVNRHVCGSDRKTVERDPILIQGSRILGIVADEPSDGELS